MSDKKYHVPALSRANDVLKLISQQPGELRITDISKILEINKSSVYTLLHTMAELDWVRKEKGDTYTLGPMLAVFSTSFFRQFDIVTTFYREAVEAEKIIGEPLQLGKLEEGDVMYLGKMEGRGRVQLITTPGMKFPAYASSLGKAQLKHYTYEELCQLYPRKQLEQKTPYTLATVDDLYENLQLYASKNYIEETQESFLGLFCVGAPIFNHNGDVIAGVSFTMLESSWSEKHKDATREIVSLAKKISKQAGYVADTEESKNEENRFKCLKRSD